MFDFEFYNPTHIVFGKNKITQLDKLVPAKATALITYGGGSAKRSGLLDRVKGELEQSGRNVLEFGGIPSNPRFDVLMEAVNVVRENKVDFILALGGGSVMDGTKFISFVSYHEEYFGKERELIHLVNLPTAVAPVPFGTVVTMPATGSEMNNGFVISDGEDKLPCFSPALFPKFSILDPENTFTLPARQVANGVVDAFEHVVEQYVTYPVEGRFQDRVAEGILQTLIEVGETTVKNPQDYDARANLVWCTTMALNGLISAGVPQDWTAHMIGHELTALFGIDHGRTLACVQPAIWKVRREQKKAKLLQYAERVWNIVNGSDDERIDAAITRTEAFFASLGVETRLSAHGVKAADIDRVIANLEKHGMTALSETRDLDLDVSRKILETAL
ncbi:MAG: iron-containing alcohol dehydrogenase [Desulforhopalus sp.]|nr:iron-containing alcohol dehydrogenase [Desulforhopalus sp.]